MKLHFFSSLMCAIVLLCGCTDAMEDTVCFPKTQDAQILQTRAMSANLASEDTLEEFNMPEDMKRMKELYTRLHSQRRKAPTFHNDSYDDTF